MYPHRFETRVAVDAPSPWAVLGRLLGPADARWCTAQMAKGTAQAFAEHD